jgi:hypothetical protein
MSIYLKRLSANDLGFRNGIKKQPGYILLSYKMIGSFFPYFEKNKIIDIDFLGTSPMSEEVYLRSYEQRSLLYLVIEPFLKKLELSAEDIIVLKKIGESRYEFSWRKPTDQDYQSLIAELGKKKSKIITSL